MIILDTNVVSVFMRPTPDERVAAWLDRQASGSLWTTVVTVYEVRFGLALLASGQRRRALTDAFERALAEDFDDRVLPLDEEAARHAAGMSAQAQWRGKRLDLGDVEIAGIVASRGAVLATRNTRHFDGLGIDLVDPWKDAAG
jgi:predicted nucleic acid-binding protein